MRTSFPRRKHVGRVQCCGERGAESAQVCTHVCPLGDRTAGQSRLAPDARPFEPTVFRAEGCDEQISTVDVRGESLTCRLRRRIGGSALAGGTMSAHRVAPADQTRAILNDLVRQRRLMQRGAADAGLLEANRLAIVYWQRQLSRSLAAEQEGAPQTAA